MHDPTSFRTLIEKVKAETDTVMVKLPVSIYELSSVFSAAALELHYDTLYRNYVKKAKDGEGEFPVAGAKLHGLFFEQLQKKLAPNPPHGAIKDLIDAKFGNFTAFKAEFAEAATAIHGSGWAYLTTTGKILTIPNHELISDVAVIIDMWEHAYVIDYGADKASYLKAMWTIIDWNTINKRFK